MSVKIQLDNAALERLLGGQTEVEVELKNCIVQEFTRRHLKSVLHDEAFQSFLHTEKEAIRLALQAKVTQNIGEVRRGSFGPTIVHINPSLASKIGEMVWEAHQKIVNSHCQQITERMEERFSRHERELNKRMEARIQNIEEQMIDAKVKEKLAGILAALK